MNIQKAGIIAGIIAILATAAPANAQRLASMGVKTSVTSPSAQDVAAVKRAGNDAALKNAIEQGDADAAKAVLLRYGASTNLAVAIPQKSTYQISSGGPYHVSGSIRQLCGGAGTYPVYMYIFQNSFWVVVFVGCKVIST